MGRYIGPKEKLSRREGVNLFLKGYRSFSDKNGMARKPYPPGQHGNKFRVRLSSYGRQLREKQKVKRMYGLREKQFKNLYKEATRRSKVSGEEKGLILLQLLESRLDNVVYRLGLAPSRAAARQMVTHKHILVNGKTVNIPSYELKVGDVVTLKKKELKMSEKLFDSPEWVETTADGGKVVRKPLREEIDPGIKESLIIEFYSR